MKRTDNIQNKKIHWTCNMNYTKQQFNLHKKAGGGSFLKSIFTLTPAAAAACVLTVRSFASAVL